MKERGPVIVILVVLSLCCCGVLIFAGILSSLSWLSFQGKPQSDSAGGNTSEPATNLPELAQPEAPPISESPPSAWGEPLSPGAVETLETLKNSLVPINDLRDLAMRLEGKPVIPETMNETPKVYKIGDQEKFWVTNTDTNQNFQVTAILQYATEHVYFWIEKGVVFDPDDVKNLVETFENETYPKNREFFGSEWTPGIDNDPHLFILYARGGGSVGGYFSAADSIHPLAHEYSNAHESFFISADYVYLGDPEASGTLAHEFQHMIHWYRDRNEESWLNEGFSVLAEFLNGYDPGWVDDDYLLQPDIQLTYWPGGDESYPHYGAAFLFVTYFLDRFGEDAARALVANPDNGMESVDAVLAEIGAKDPQTGLQLTADDVFADWAVANYLNSPALADGRFSYHIYQDVPQVMDTEILSKCPTNWENGSVNQFGVDYLRIKNCSDNFTLEFMGLPEVRVTPKDAHSGEYYFWSNKGDESHITLTKTFDFTEITGSLNLSYWVWYDLEKDYDYLYLTASLDGEQWEILKTPSCTTDDPSGNSYGCGYNGSSEVWIREDVDLTKFMGKVVQLRFEYVTDAAVNGEGLLLDDISIPEIQYKSDFETDDGGWEAAGFVRIQNRLPQTFRLAILHDGQDKKVEMYEVTPGQPVSIPIATEANGNDLIFVVSGTTRFTHQPAEYQFTLK